MSTGYVSGLVEEDLDADEAAMGARPSHQGLGGHGGRGAGAGAGAGADREGGHGGHGHSRKMEAAAAMVASSLENQSHGSKLASRKQEAQQFGSVVMKPANINKSSFQRPQSRGIQK